MLAFLGKIFLDRRTNFRVRDGRQRTLIAYRGQLLGERVGGQKPHQNLDVMRLDATLFYVRRFVRAGPASHPQCALRDGRITVALPSVVFSALAFSSQISQSTRWLLPSLYFLVTLPLQVTFDPGWSIPRYCTDSFFSHPSSPAKSVINWPRKAFLSAPWRITPGRLFLSAKSLS